MAIPENPITREEAYLAGTAGQKVALPSRPITREEKYLAKIAGEEVELPRVPITRKEQYLNAIAENGAGGGGGGEAETGKKTVHFVDYDGTELFAYSAEKAKALSAMPTPPENERLVFQGWNWTLEGMKAYLENHPGATVIVGANYTTKSGDTELDIEIGQTGAGQELTLAMYGTGGKVRIDWGDGGSAEGDAGYYNHAWEKPGSYTVKIRILSGVARLRGDDNRGCLYLSTSSDDISTWTKAAYLAGGMQLGNYAFSRFYSMRTLSLPSEAEVANDAFMKCYHLKALVLPATVANGSRIESYGLEVISLPEAYSGAVSAPYGAYREITLPEGVTSASISSSVREIVLPDGVTSLENRAFASFNVLERIVAPKKLSEIGTLFLHQSFGVEVLDFSRVEAVPALSSMGTIRNDYTVLVPADLLESFQSAAVWSTMAKHMVGV